MNARPAPALPTLSQRMQRIDAPIIPTIAALVRANPGTISLGQGVVRYGPPPGSLAMLGEMDMDPTLNRYQSVFGCAPLVDALRAKLADENGIFMDADANEMMVTAGSNSGFLAAVMATGDAGDEFILPSPFFFNHEMAVRMAHCTPVIVPTTSDYQLDLTAIETAITPRTRAIVTVTPNNPTGAVYHPADLRAVNALCARRGIYHFSDEAYEYFVHDPQATHFSVGSLPGAAAHTLSFFSFSKAWGMASWRVGYVVYPVALSEAMCKVQDTNLICAPVASQYAALGALREGRQSITPHLNELSRVRDSVFEALAPLDGLAEVPRTEGAFYAMVRLPGLAAGVDPLEFNAEMIRRHQVATIPGFAFGLTDVQSANYQRLSYGSLEPATVRQGIQRFVQAVQRWYDR